MLVLSLGFWSSGFGFWIFESWFLNIYYTCYCWIVTFGFGVTFRDFGTAKLIFATVVQGGDCLTVFFIDPCYLEQMITWCHAVSICYGKW